MVKKKSKKQKKPKKIISHDPARLLKLAEASYHQGNYKKAIQYNKDASLLAPHDADIYNTLGVLYNIIGDPKQEQKSYIQALNIDPFHSGANYNLGTIYRINGNRKKAITHLKRSIKNNPQNLTTLNNLANLLTEDKQFDEALEYYNTILRIDPNFVNAIINKGYLYLEQGALKKSISLFNRAILVAPENGKAHIYKAEAMFIEEDPQKNLERLDSIAALKHLDIEEKINVMVAKATCEWIRGDLSSLRNSLTSVENIIFQVKKNTNIANLKRRQAYYVYLKALSEYATKTKRKDEEQNLPIMPIIGDSHCLSPAHQKIILDGTEYKCEPHLISGIKAWHLGNSAKNKYKYAFDRTLQKLDRCPAIFTIGEIDCRSDEGIFSYHQKTDIPLKGIIMETVDLFLKFVANRINGTGITSIFCGVPAPDNVKIQKLSEQDKEKYLFTVRQFNSYLLSQVQANGARFIDIYKATSGPNGTSNNKYDLDKLHLKPDFFEKYLQHYLI